MQCRVIFEAVHGQWTLHAKNDRVPSGWTPSRCVNSAVECHLHTSSRFNTFNNLDRLNLRGFSPSLHLRYFGPRDLISDGIYRSEATALLNAEVGYQINETWRISTEFLNL